MKFRVSPFWWPILAALSPVALPWLFVKARRFQKGRIEAANLNEKRIASASTLDLPEVDSFELTAIVEEKAEEGFLGDAAISYLIRTDRGSVLMDLGFGDERPALSHNAKVLGLSGDDADALFISHLHLDHMGGQKAARRKEILAPDGFFSTPKTTYVPAPCTGNCFEIKQVQVPEVIDAGLATTGPLARMLWFFGLAQEQAVVTRLKGKGLVVVTGCGHPTIEVIIKMVKEMSDLPIYAVVGGLHFPVSASRGARLGIEFQQILGTGKPWWDRIDDKDLSETIKFLNEVSPQKLLLSAHDTCDHALDRFANEAHAMVEIIRAGKTYIL
jgi:7,8-dihydropterin-6-yl-methyl-4-(beta-D-ribofuranosyl)aminobenzene 5'-phosphate synthase